VSRLGWLFWGHSVDGKSRLLHFPFPHPTVVGNGSISESVVEFHLIVMGAHPLVDSGVCPCPVAQPSVCQTKRRHKEDYTNQII